METDTLTRAERGFRLWMYISAWMYGLSGLFFLVVGSRIAPFVNTVSERFTALPPYPLPAAGAEGAFWQALSLSMMAMITWICRAAYLDPRRNGRLVPLLLLSKFCSSAFYIAFFAARGHLVCLVGFLTDFPLFVATLVLWLPAAAGDKFIDGAEEDILMAVGEALMPPGGAFDVGYADARERCLADARRMFAAQSPLALAVLRFMLRALDTLPVIMTLRPVTLRRLPPEERRKFLSRLDSHRSSTLRMIFFTAKLEALLPFFNQPEVEREVGWTLEEPKQ